MSTEAFLLNRLTEHLRNLEVSGTWLAVNEMIPRSLTPDIVPIVNDVLDYLEHPRQWTVMIHGDPATIRRDCRQGTLNCRYHGRRYNIGHILDGLYPDIRTLVRAASGTSLDGATLAQVYDVVGLMLTWKLFYTHLKIKSIPHWGITIRLGAQLPPLVAGDRRIHHPFIAPEA